MYSSSNWVGWLLNSLNTFLSSFDSILEPFTDKLLKPILLRFFKGIQNHITYVLILTEISKSNTSTYANYMLLTFLPSFTTKFWFLLLNKSPSPFDTRFKASISRVIIPVIAYGISNTILQMIYINQECIYSLCNWSRYKHDMKVRKYLSVYISFCFSTLAGASGSRLIYIIWLVCCDPLDLFRKSWIHYSNFYFKKQIFFILSLNYLFLQVLISSSFQQYVVYDHCEVYAIYNVLFSLISSYLILVNNIYKELFASLG